MDVPRGEPRQALAAVAEALAAREPAETLRERLAEAAEAVLTVDERADERSACRASAQPRRRPPARFLLTDWLPAVVP